jgi:methionine aminopeptidase
MRKVCRLAREVLDIAARAAKPGVTTDYIDEIVHKACMEREVRLCEQQQQQEYALILCSRTLHPSTTATFPSQYAHR